MYKDSMPKKKTPDTHPGFLDHSSDLTFSKTSAAPFFSLVIQEHEGDFTTISP
ncbi:hypothetical protein HanHA300_Chr13g0469841 [Helianthus annuus]|nr:hypothetical protein HanHA300_Chr13g0469841 [Helianthus annuus]KAJ0662645.1 hypothetical protein HanLR1_Chr13g0472051 [Helianthus annuus]